MGAAKELEVEEGVNVPRRRNIAEGFSLDSLCISAFQYLFAGRRDGGEKEGSWTHMPKSWNPFPGQWKCTVAPNPSGNRTTIINRQSPISIVNSFNVNEL